jgi:hypothetical protein
MLELVAGGVQVVDAGRPSDATSGATVSLGRHTLRGEIVDAKCWLGVMKPGAGKSHRACASLCIRGGIPPLFVARRGDVVRQMLLVGADGREVNLEVLDYVAEGVEIEGEVLRTGDQWTLRADLDSLRRLHDS